MGNDPILRLSQSRVRTSTLRTPLIGRGARERSEFYWLKASYFTLKFHPRYLITLVTSHDRSPFKNKLGSQNKNRTCNDRLSADCYTI